MRGLGSRRSLPSICANGNEGTAAAASYSVSPLPLHDAPEQPHYTADGPHSAAALPRLRRRTRCASPPRHQGVRLTAVCAHGRVSWRWSIAPADAAASTLAWPRQARRCTAARVPVAPPLEPRDTAAEGSAVQCSAVEYSERCATVIGPVGRGEAPGRRAVPAAAVRPCSAHTSWRGRRRRAQAAAARHSRPRHRPPR